MTFSLSSMFRWTAWAAVFTYFGVQVYRDYDGPGTIVLYLTIMLCISPLIFWADIVDWLLGVGKNDRDHK